MKRIWVKIGIIICVIIVAVGVGVLSSYMKISSVDLSVMYPDSLVVITKNEIQDDLLRQFGNFTSYRKNQIETDDIKNYLEKQDFIDLAVVSISLRGQLRITVTQKQIIARVYNAKNNQFYIDAQQRIIKISPTTKVANGLVVITDMNKMPNSIIDSVADKNYYKIYTLASMLNEDNVLRDWISTIINNNKQWLLLASFGDCTVKLSDDEELWKSELEKLHYFVGKHGYVELDKEDKHINETIFGLYEDIDLTFHNQVVCRKKE